MSRKVQERVTEKKRPSKTCPKCGGAVFVTSYGPHDFGARKDISCVKCGYSCRVFYPEAHARVILETAEVQHERGDCNGNAGRSRAPDVRL